MRDDANAETPILGVVNEAPRRQILYLEFMKIKNTMINEKDFKSLMRPFFGVGVFG